MTIQNQSLQFTITQLANSETIERNFALGLTALANQTDANQIKLALVSNDSLTKLENVTATSAQLNRLASISSADAIFTSSTVNIRDNNISLGTINLNKLADISPNSILANNTNGNGSPSAITVNPSTLIGRTNNGVLSALTVDQITVLLNSDISEKITNTKLNIASAQQASDGVSNDVLMTPVRVQSVIDSLSFSYSDFETISPNSILGNNTNGNATATPISIPQNTVLGRRNNNVEPLNVDNLTQLINLDTSVKISNDKLNIASSAEATSGTSTNLMTAARTQELFDSAVADLTSGDGRNVDYELVRSANINVTEINTPYDTQYDIPNDAADFLYVFGFKRGSAKEFSSPIRGAELLNLFTTDIRTNAFNVNAPDADGNHILVIEIGVASQTPTPSPHQLLFARTNANDLLVGATSTTLDPTPLEIWRIPLVAALPADSQTNNVPENRLIPNEGNENFVLTKTSDTDFDVDWQAIPQANQAQAEDGTNDNVFMTPLRTAQAIAELAVTDAITDIPTASESQAVAGTDNENYMTPLRTSQAIAALAPTSSGGGDGTVRTEEVNIGWQGRIVGDVVIENNVPVSTHWTPLPFQRLSQDDVDTATDYDWLIRVRVNSSLSGTRSETLPWSEIILTNDQFTALTRVDTTNPITNSITNNGAVALIAFNKTSGLQEFRDGVQFFFAIDRDNPRSLLFYHSNVGSSRTNNYRISVYKRIRSITTVRT